jgi:hypothetical protein
MKSQVVPCGAAVADVFHRKFYGVDADALVSQDCITFSLIDAIMAEVKAAAAAPAPVQAAPVQAAPAAPASAQRSLLGEIPTFTKKAKKEKKKSVPAEPVVIQQSFVAPKTVSKQAEQSKFACALNGHTMKVPVITPYGHTFEKETIEQWIQQQGTVCPITGNVLSLSDLQPNVALQNEIMQEVVLQSMKSGNQEDEMDLYDF